MEYEFHTLAAVFPMMTGAEVNELGEDMLKHAQREPIWTYEGKILDGRNRYNACLLKGIEPRFAEFHGADPLAFVVSANLHRRQLNAGQRALVVETLASIPHGGDRRSVQAATIAVVAKVGKVSPCTMSTTKALKRDAIPTVVDAVKRGEVPIAQAAAFASKTPPLDQARLIADLGSPAAAAKAAIGAKADRATVKIQKRKVDVTAAVDRAETTAAAKAASSDNTLIGLLMLFERMREAINLDTAIDDLSKADLANMNALITRAHGWMGIVVSKIRALARIPAATASTPIARRCHGFSRAVEG